MRVLLVEPWFGGSHRAWAEGYARHSNHDVQLLTLPDEAWRWRLRGGAVTLAARVDQPPDVILASSLLDVARFLGHARRVVGDVPVVLYMHENQLTYPLPSGTRRDMDAALTNWASMVVSDLVVFNSEHHRRSWFEALPGMLRTMPEPDQLDLIEGVKARSTTLPVGVEMDWIRSTEPARVAAADPPLLVWNHRWQQDKRPDVLVAALARLIERGTPARVAVLGERQTGTPAALTRLPSLLGERLVQFGHVPRDAYERFLGEADVVLSTADHEFFGVAVVEAMAAGARPVLPDRLSYPELLPPDSHAEVLWSTHDDLDAGLDRALLAGRGSLPAVTEYVRRFSWDEVAPRYDTLLDGLA